MNIPNGYAADLQAAYAIECEASAGPGTYGAVVRAYNIPCNL